MARTRIKICGIMDEDGLLGAVDAGADAVGFSFHPKSRRFIEPEEAFELTSLLPPFVSSVGVFVDATVDRFSDLEEVCPTDRSQLAGDESEAVVRACGPSLIKAVKFDKATIERELQRWEKIDDVDAVMIDVSGVMDADGRFDWALLKPAMSSVKKPVMITGGLTPVNVGEVVRELRPYAVDVAGGVESEPGVKDRGLMEAFCRAVRAAEIG